MIKLSKNGWEKQDEDEDKKGDEKKINKNVKRGKTAMGVASLSSW